jgi:hypothetical protein
MAQLSSSSTSALWPTATPRPPCSHDRDRRPRADRGTGRGRRCKPAVAALLRVTGTTPSAARRCSSPQVSRELPTG